MAGDWIKMRNDLADDPAVIGIAAQIGIDEFAVVGRLHALWVWADEQSRDGHAAGVTSAWLDRRLQRDGFADALVSVGWLVVDRGGLHIPNFDNHNGKSAKARALATRRKQRERASPEKPEKPSRPRHVVSVTETRPEKRREEKKKEISASRKTSLPEGFGISERVRSWAAEKGYRHLEKQLEALISHAKRNGAKYLDWDEALMTAIRGDWARVGAANGTDAFAGAH